MRCLSRRRHRIEELTLTYVVVHLWDERRLELPATYFTTTPFQNWTRSESRVLATVELHLDPTAPVAAVRERAHELIEANPLWDRREWMVQVTGMSELTIVGRVLASASDAASAWDLKCDLREELIRWLQDEHPNAFLRWSSEHRTIGPEPLTSATTSAPHLGRGLR